MYKGNIKKTICRVNLDKKNKQLFIPMEDKKYEKIYIQSSNDLYLYRDKLIDVVSRYTGNQQN